MECCHLINILHSQSFVVRQSYCFVQYREVSEKLTNDKKLKETQRNVVKEYLT